MTRRWTPIDPDALAGRLAEHLHLVQPPGPALRVAVDGPRCADPVGFAASLAAPLRALGHDTTVIDSDTFWRDASLRLEYGHEDVTSFRSWLDTEALRREVLDPLGPGGSGHYLPSLRDPVTNRSRRESMRIARLATVVVVAGPFLLDAELPFDVAVHLTLSAAARERRTASDERWTLDAYTDYDREVRPTECADAVVKLDDPRHPALAIG
ncbi:MAG TPA: hypothetical protein VGN35_13640 [Jatrophihabitantaceae bacterium]|nr:hypothetical protein [Jatrophihabitantaceae bacterium]